MIKKISPFTILLLNRLSPSQYYSALLCPYKLVLANSLNYESLFPLNANAHFGSICHKLIELISRGIIFDDKSFIEHWSELINNKEEELKRKGLSNIVPLKYFVTDFALKKNQLKYILQKKISKTNQNQPSASNKYLPEKKLYNLDRTITGIADLIIENDYGISILDFKTGRIHTDEIDEYGRVAQVIKKEYESQLKLYAHLYFLMNDKYPTKLYLVTLTDDFVEIQFTKDQCEEIYIGALDFLSKTNAVIKNKNFESIARPCVENCKYCAYRPACISYLKWLPANLEAMYDLVGVIEAVTSFSNDTIGLQLLVNNRQILVNGLSLEMMPDFKKLIGNKVALFNLKKSKETLNGTANNFTIAYEY